MSGKGKAANPVQIFVRIGALKRFDTLKRKTADLPVTVSWDRRRGERRSAASPAGEDRRRADRRSAAPFTWDAADFVVVEEPPPAAGTRRPRRRPDADPE
jgi:hypothetical protein